MPVVLVAGMLLTEFVVHGYDLATTHGQRLPVPDEAAHQALLTACSFTPIVLTPWARARTMTYAYAPHGHRPIVMELDRGAVTVSHDEGRPVDAWFGGSAIELLLVSYHRVGTLRSMRTLRLRGRRPYLALVTGKAFDTA